MDENKLLQQAKRQIAFKRHALTFSLVNIGLIGLDYFDNGRLDWFLAPLLGWGVGLLVHGISTYMTHQWFSVEKEMESLRRKEQKKRL